MSFWCTVFCFFFFFQAEDGIRDYKVTGVQTCALPIYVPSCFARSTSTWIHWWSSVASAKVFTRSWVISIHGLVPSSWPLSEGSSAMVVVVATRVPPSSVVGRLFPLQSAHF